MNKEEGNIVLVDVTADWCLTCKFNKMVIFRSKNIKDMILNGKVKFVQADWTLPNKDILYYLASFSKYGIPFNVIYGPNDLKGIVLPEILTPKSILQAYESAS